MKNIKRKQKRDIKIIDEKEREKITKNHEILIYKLYLNDRLTDLISK